MSNKIPKVRLAVPKGRPIQLRYTCQIENREIRISTGTRDVAEAAKQKETLEAKLLLGIDAKRRRRSKAGPAMDWQAFRNRYTELQLSTIRDRSAKDCEYRLDMAERILKPHTLGEVADSEALHKLQQSLLAGVESRYGKPRSPHTVKTNMAVVMAALKWAEYMEWLPTVPRLRKIKTTRLKHMKGRPITTEEFERMLDATPDVVGAPVAESWRQVLHGLWESGLRLSELMHVHLTDSQYIVPDWSAKPFPVLAIPASMQKNATEESIPLLPGFESLLLETDPTHGWAFNPGSLQGKKNRKPRTDRINPEWVGKVITKIGKKAGVVVVPATTTQKAKFASAHDLRRSCADRLVAAGVPEREVAAILRHASVETTRRHYAPGSVQRSAGIIREKLSVPRYIKDSEDLEKSKSA